jgi:hypothetical protein
MGRGYASPESGVGNVDSIMTETTKPSQAAAASLLGDLMAARLNLQVVRAVEPPQTGVSSFSDVET